MCMAWKAKAIHHLISHDLLDSSGTDKVPKHAKCSSTPCAITYPALSSNVRIQLCMSSNLDFDLD